MIQTISRYFIYKDERGKFEGLINFGNWKEFNLVETEERETFRGKEFKNLF